MSGRNAREKGRRGPAVGAEEKMYVWIDEPMEIHGVNADEVGNDLHEYDLHEYYRRTPLAFLYEGGRLRHVEPLSTLVASPRKWANVYRAHVLIYLEDDGGRRSAYVEVCRLPFAICEAAEDAAARIWKEGGTEGGVIEAVESLAV